MNRTQKVNTLYSIAKGNKVSLSLSERMELSKYRIDRGGESSFYLTKKNLSDYVKAVDEYGEKLSFLDWCMNNGLADRRFKGSDQNSMAKANMRYVISCGIKGFIPWGICAVMYTGNPENFLRCGGIAFLICLVSRRFWVFFVIILPLVLSAIGFALFH